MPVLPRFFGFLRRGSRMQLWNGEIDGFVRDAQAGALTPAMIGRFYTYHGCQPNESEVRAWNNSLAALADVSEPLRRQDLGVVIEYHLPFSNQRIDAVFLGKSFTGRAKA